MCELLSCDLFFHYSFVVPHTHEIYVTTFTANEMPCHHAEPNL